MSNDTENKFEQFKTQLITRLRAHPKVASGAFHLNLRHKAYPGQDRLILHDPAAAAVGQRGATTRNEHTATRWVEQFYAAELFEKLTGTKVARDRTLMTFGDLCDEYLEGLLADLGPTHHTYQNRRSLVERHLKPRFGTKLLSDMTRDEVADFIDGLMITKPDAMGRMVTKPAKLGTKRNVRNGMLAIWRDTMKGPAPYAGIRLTKERRRKKSLTKDDFAELLRPKSGAMTAEQAMRALTAAMWYDVTIIAGRPNMNAIAVANTAATMALQIGTGMRIEELLELQWWMVKFDEAYIIVPGSKTENATRPIPLQEQVRPWLLFLRKMQEDRYGAVNDEAYVVHTSVRSPEKRGSKGSAGNRIKEALLFAGLKRPSKRTHWARATHLTWGTLAPELVTLEQLKAYVGHVNPYRDATDAYVATLIAMMPMAHRRYIQHLPSPDEVRARVAEFVPVSRTDRVMRRRPPRSEAAAERAAERQQKRLAELRQRRPGK